MGQLLDGKHRVLVLQRVIAVVVAKRPLGPPQAGRHLPHQGKLRAGDQRMGVAIGARDLGQALAGNE
jgi:hypothetical protein